MFRRAESGVSWTVLTATFFLGQLADSPISPTPSAAHLRRTGDLEILRKMPTTGCSSLTANTTSIANSQTCRRRTYPVQALVKVVSRAPPSKCPARSGYSEVAVSDSFKDLKVLYHEKEGYFHELVANDDVDAVCWLLENRSDLVGHLVSALSVAVGFHAYEVAELLIQNGADVCQPDPMGNTPLINAVRYDDLDLCRLLLHHRADPSQPNDLGETPIGIGA